MTRKMIDDERPQDTHGDDEGTLDITVPAYLFLTVLACGITFLIHTKLWYWDGAGKHHLNPVSLLVYQVGTIVISIWLAIKLIICIVETTRKSSWAARIFFLILLVVNILLIPFSCMVFGPGYRQRTQGFAARVKEQSMLNDGVRHWIATETAKDRRNVYPLTQCPEAVQKTFKTLTMPWPGWKIYFEQNGTARLANGGGLDHEWGLAICLNHKQLPLSDEHEYRIPIDGERYAYHKIQE